jgi:hypothetical protein
MRIHLLIDWENERPTGAELELVRGSRFRLWILHGPQQKSFTAEQVSAWQPLGKQVRFVQSAKSGKNALDLHIAYCIGVASEHDRGQENPGCYVIVSKDKGFDALFGYLQNRDLRVARAESLTEAMKLASKLMEGVEVKALPVPASAPKPRTSENAARVVEDLRVHPKNRPTTSKRLNNHVKHLLGNEGSPGEVSRVTEELKALKVIVLNGTKLDYHLKKK